jgi:hypothetical protein
VKYLRPGSQLERATFDGLTSQNPEALALGERAVDQGDVLSEHDREHTCFPRLGVEAAAGRLADYRDLHIQRGFLCGRTRSTWELLAPVGPVPVAKLTHVAVPAVFPKNGLGGCESQHCGDRTHPPAQFLFHLHQ